MTTRPLRDQERAAEPHSPYTCPVWTVTLIKTDCQGLAERVGEQQTLCYRRVAQSEASGLVRSRVPIAFYHPEALVALAFTN